MVEEVGLLEKYLKKPVTEKFKCRFIEELVNPIQIFLFKKGGELESPINNGQASNLLQALKGYHHCTAKGVFIETIFLFNHLQPGAIANNNDGFYFIIDNDWVKERLNKAFQITPSGEYHLTPAEWLTKEMFVNYCISLNENGIYYAARDGNVFVDPSILSTLKMANLTNTLDSIQLFSDHQNLIN